MSMEKPTTEAPPHLEPELLGEAGTDAIRSDWRR